MGVVWKKVARLETCQIKLPMHMVCILITNGTKEQPLNAMSEGYWLGSVPKFYAVSPNRFEKCFVNFSLATGVIYIQGDLGGSLSAVITLDFHS